MARTYRWRPTRDASSDAVTTSRWPTSTPAWDSLTALEAWVERGVVPVNQVVADTIGVPGRTRPLCEWPAYPRYNGSGDVNAAASFACVAP